MIKLLLCVCFSFFVPHINATTTKEVFAKFPNKYFIETGSLYGEGIQMALDVGFEQVFSIELAPFYHEYCRLRFATYPNVRVLFGDSSEELPYLLKQIDAPATFWLDGHYSGKNTAKGDKNSPILEELEAIKQHTIKTHTLMIDDIRQCGTIEFDYVELDEIIKKVLEINPNYTIHFEDGHVPNDVLIARIIP